MTSISKIIYKMLVIGSIAILVILIANLFKSKDDALATLNIKEDPLQQELTILKKNNVMLEKQKLAFTSDFLSTSEKETEKKQEIQEKIDLVNANIVENQSLIQTYKSVIHTLQHQFEQQLDEVYSKSNKILIGILIVIIVFFSIVIFRFAYYIKSPIFAFVPFLYLLFFFYLIYQNTQPPKLYNFVDKQANELQKQCKTYKDYATQTNCYANIATFLKFSSQRSFIQEQQEKQKFPFYYYQNITQTNKSIFEILNTLEAQKAEQSLATSEAVIGFIEKQLQTNKTTSGREESIHTHTNSNQIFKILKVEKKKNSIGTVCSPSPNPMGEVYLHIKRQ